MRVLATSGVGGLRPDDDSLGDSWSDGGRGETKCAVPYVQGGPPSHTNHGSSTSSDTNGFMWGDGADIVSLWAVYQRCRVRRARQRRSCISPVQRRSQVSPHPPHHRGKQPSNSILIPSPPILPRSRRRQSVEANKKTIQDLNEQIRAAEARAEELKRSLGETS